MTLMVDASAIVALMRDEPEAPELSHALVAADRPFTNAIAMWEATRAIARGSARRLDESLEEVERYCTAFGITVTPINPADATWSVLAQQRYGKGTGHPARLNMGDCFAYASAKTNEARLLYKGDDFFHTDLG